MEEYSELSVGDLSVPTSPPEEITFDNQPEKNDVWKCLVKRKRALLRSNPPGITK